MKRWTKTSILLLLCCCTVLSEQPQKRASASKGSNVIDDAALRNADARTGEWITHGRTYAETRFSPLTQINESNVKQLRLVGSFDTETTRGREARPIMSDGVMYTTGIWSVVVAIDARTGKQRWKWDPQVPRTTGY